MDGLILAAGQGIRMGNMEKPKCLLDVGGIQIIDYQINCFKKLGIEKIFVVIGHKSDQIKNHLDQKVTFIHNPNYMTSNNLYSIWAAKNYLQNDFICIYSDLLFHNQILYNCISDKNEICLAVEKNIRDETMRVKIKNNYIVEVNKTIPIELASGNFIGMIKFKKQIIPTLFNKISELIKVGNHEAYFTKAIESMITNGQKVDYIETNNLPWLDIDEKHELLEARKIYQNMKTGGF